MLVAQPEDPKQERQLCFSFWFKCSRNIQSELWFMPDARLYPSTCTNIITVGIMLICSRCLRQGHQCTSDTFLVGLAIVESMKGMPSDITEVLVVLKLCSCLVCLHGMPLLNSQLRISKSKSLWIIEHTGNSSTLFPQFIHKMVCACRY